MFKRSKRNFRRRNASSSSSGEDGGGGDGGGGDGDKSDPEGAPPPQAASRAAPAENGATNPAAALGKAGPASVSRPQASIVDAEGGGGGLGVAGRRKRREEKAAAVSAVAVVTKAANLLSFQDEVEDVELEVFQLKRPSYSRKVARQLKKDYEDERGEPGDATAAVKPAGEVQEGEAADNAAAVVMVAVMVDSAEGAVVVDEAGGK
ncbi:unnamed protein product, partial [Lampetra fluviatilis]